MSDKQRSIIKNAFYGLASWILPLGLSFVATPVIIKTLGYHEYGIYSLVFGFVAYSFTFNLGRAVTKYVAEYAGAAAASADGGSSGGGENEKIKDVISAALFINVVIGLCGLLTFVVFSEPLVSGVFNIETESQAKTVLALYIASAMIFFAMLGQVFNAILQGLHRFDVYSKISNFSSFSMMSGNLVIAWLGYGLIPLFWWNLLIAAITCLLYYVAAKKLWPGFALFHSFSKSSLNLVIKYSAGIVGYQILANLLVLFERTWITRRLGTESLTFYVVPMTLSFQIHFFIASMVIVIFPLASELNNEREKLLRLYAKAMKIAALLVFFIAATVIAQSNHFLTLWMGGDFAAAATDLLIIHTITFSLSAILSISWQMTEGLGHTNFNCFIYLLSLLITVPLMIFLSADFGNTGVAVGRMSGFVFLFLTILYVESWFFGRIQFDFWLKNLSRILAAALIAFAVERLLIGFLPTGWVSVFASAAAGGAFYLAAVWLLGLISADETALFKKVFKINE